MQGSLDALVNNAAITSDEPASNSLAKRLTAAFRTNSTGPAIVVEAFESLLAKSEGTPRIVNVTSGAGSIALRLDYENAHQKMSVVCFPFALFLST